MGKGKAESKGKAKLRAEAAAAEGDSDDESELNDEELAQLEEMIADYDALGSDGSGSDSSDSDGSDDDLVASETEEEEEEGVGEEVRVDFEFFDPREADYHTTKLLMRGLCGGADDINTAALADAVAGQVEVGTVVRAGAAEEVGAKTNKRDAKGKGAADGDTVAFASALGLGTHAVATSSVISTLKAAAHAKDAAKISELMAEGDKAALLLVQRAAGLPFELATNLVRALFEDIAWARENAEGGAQSFSFERLLHTAPCWRLDAGVGGERSASEVPRKKQKKEKRSKRGRDLDFARWEDRAMLQHAEWYCVVDGHNAADAAGPLAEGASPAMAIMCIPVAAEAKLLQSLSELMADLESGCQ